MKRKFTVYPSNYIKASKFVAEYYISGPVGAEESKRVIIDADNLDEATTLAQNRSEARYYDNVVVSDYTSDQEQMYMVVVDVKCYPERANGSIFMPRRDGEYISITAKNEQQARQYYDHNLWGKYCDRHCNLSDKGYWKLGKLIDCYPIGKGTGKYDATVGA